MSALNKLKRSKQRRRYRIRSKIAEVRNGRHRVSVFRSNRSISVQVIDDDKGLTLAACSSDASKGKTVVAAKEVGQSLGKLCVEKGLNNLVFDRGGYLFHGRVKAVADGMRESGIKF
jgi:large subunit ribosomal protein L18